MNLSKISLGIEKHGKRKHNSFIGAISICKKNSGNRERL